LQCGANSPPRHQFDSRAIQDDAELLVFDDASDDGISVVLDSWIRRVKRVRMIQSADRWEVAQLGMPACVPPTSDFVGSMDADEIYLPWRFNVLGPRACR
jgi:hypothetical protein